MQTIVQQTRVRMEKALDNLRQELSRIRSGRASLAILEDVKIDCYGQQMPLNHVATLNIPEPRLITIQPWEVSNIPAIEKAIQQAQLGLSTSNDGRIVRLPIPPLNEERRKEIVKRVKKLGEEAKVAMRNIRRDANEEARQAKEDGASEDVMKRAQQEIQKLTDECIAKVDQSLEAKEAEVMTV